MSNHAFGSGPYIRRPPWAFPWNDMDQVAVQRDVWMSTGWTSMKLLVTTLALVAAGCGQPTDPAPVDAGTRESSSPREEHESPDDDHGGKGLGFDRPPPVTVDNGTEAIKLEAWTFCYDSGCADGAPPEDPPDVGSPEEIFVRFSLEDWSFQASFEAAGVECSRIQSTRLETTGDGFVLRPIGHAGTYDVTLFGRGSGDLFVTFRWTTPTDGPLPEPEARAAILADHDGRVDSYGVELSISNLAETPKRAAATITVEAENGESHTFEAEPTRQKCLPEGSLYWDGPDDEGLAAAELGDGSGTFTYTIELVLDGERHVATAQWPEDTIKGNEPSVHLEFSPPLPALE